MDVDRQEVIITLTRNKHSLTPLAVEELTTLQDLRLVVRMTVTVCPDIYNNAALSLSLSQIDKLTSLDKARLLYINEEGNAVALESDGKYFIFVSS